jgi:hypothetical protein
MQIRDQLLAGRFLGYLSYPILRYVSFVKTKALHYRVYRRPSKTS